ncbi:MAG: RagB/SusD family nutrient uptake outer membrane protein [Bacteroidota bacterium]
MKTFKHIFFLPALGAAFLGVVGCSNLDDKVLDRPSAADLKGISSVIDPVSSLQGVYSQLNPIANSQEQVYALQEHSTDEMMGPTRGTDWSDFGIWRRLHQHSWDGTHRDIINSWDVMNTGAFRATQTIYLASTSTTLSEAEKTRIIAEARFLRAFFMFQLVDLFGQVPFREATDDPESVPVVKTRAEATQFILDDLTAAIDKLAPGNPGVANKEAAQFLFAKVYLNRAVYTQNPQQPAGAFNFAQTDMTKVIEYCDAITSTSKFQLEPSGEYFDNFHWDNGALSKELIFVIQNSSGSPVGNVRDRYFMTLHYNQKPSGWNGFTTLASFYNSFEANDERLGKAIPGLTDQIGLRAGFLVGQQYDKDGAALKDRAGGNLTFSPDVDLLYSNEKQGIRVIKYLPEATNLDNPGNDYVFFRYADVVLMKAEALLRGGIGAGTALELVNQLRTARGATALPSVDLPILLAERGRELYWEGWRRNDMIRFGTFLNPNDTKPKQSPNHVVVFPVPQRALDTNPNLKQNFGY